MARILLSKSHTMRKYKILLVEDDIDFGSIMQKYLNLHNFEVTWVQEAEKALSYLQGAKENMDEQFKICVLDVMIPGRDGFSLATEIKKTDPQIPFVFLTAKALKEDQMRGLQLGAYDYITKPFDVDLLLLRLINIIERHTNNALIDQGKEKCHIGRYLFDPYHHVLMLGEEKQLLTVKETKLISYLNRNRNRLLKREELLKEVWNSTDYFTGRSMDVFLTRVRKYFNQDPNISLESTRGVGLVFKVEARS